MDSKYFLFIFSIYVNLIFPCEIHPECPCGPVTTGTKTRILQLAGPKTRAEFLNKTVYFPKYTISNSCLNATISLDCTPQNVTEGYQLVWGLATNAFYSDSLQLSSPYFSANFICNQSQSDNWMYADGKDVLVASCAYGPP